MTDPNPFEPPPPDFRASTWRPILVKIAKVLAVLMLITVLAALALFGVILYTCSSH